MFCLLTGFVDSLLASLIQVLVCLFCWVPVTGKRRPLPNLRRTSRGAKEVKDGGVFSWLEAESIWEGGKRELLMWVVYLYRSIATISKTDQEVVKMRIAAGLMRRDPSDPNTCFMSGQWGNNCPHWQVMYDLTFFSEVCHTLRSQ